MSRSKLLESPCRVLICGRWEEMIVSLLPSQVGDSRALVDANCVSFGHVTGGTAFRDSSSKEIDILISLIHPVFLSSDSSFLPNLIFFPTLFFSNVLFLLILAIFQISPIIIKTPGMIINVIKPMGDFIK